MPDWSYQTILRPGLFLLPAQTARAVTLNVTASLAHLPLGSALIDLMGKMQPPPEVACEAFGITFPSPVGLGAGLDMDGRAASSLTQFGFGFLELGPVSLCPTPGTSSLVRWIGKQAIRFTPVSSGIDAVVDNLKKYRRRSSSAQRVPIGVRLSHRSGLSPTDAAHECVQMMLRLTDLVDFFTLDFPTELVAGLWDAAQYADYLAKVANDALNSNQNRVASKPLLVSILPDLDSGITERIVTAALQQNICGVVVSGGIADSAGQRLVGRPTHDKSLQMVRFLHTRYAGRLTIIGSGGIIEPKDALEYLAAGASLVQIHSGFVYSGPGLPKRINEAIAYYRIPHEQRPEAPTSRNWLWIGLLGVGLIVAGAVAWAVAITRTVLPYDEAFVGMTREGFIAINDRLLPFMAHDRVTLAGTMMSSGALYIGWAIGGLRRGSKWSRQGIIISATAGFLSFILFLSYGYFDPLHFVLTVGLLPLLVLSLFGTNPPTAECQPNLTNNRRWLLGQWGQLLFIVIGFGLILAGTTIAVVGSIHVFVPEDLEFMQTTAQALNAANPHLLALIAHDRVGFGGNLVSSGFGVLLLSLWGFRQGARWVWWTLLAAGLPGFVAALGIHLAVDYLNLWHLFPAIMALVFFIVGLGLAFPYLYYPDRTMPTGN